jgi:hypothetical protein
MGIRFVLAAAVVACVACNRKVDEPQPTTANPPATASSSAAPITSTSGYPSSSTMTPTIYAPAPTASDGPDPKAPFGPKEFKEFHIKISNEDCEKAAEKKNTLEGLPIHDKKGTLLIWACLREGNVAWYRCVINADTSEHFNWCSQRYLIQPEEAKLQKP